MSVTTIVRPTPSESIVWPLVLTRWPLANLEFQKSLGHFKFSEDISPVSGAFFCGFVLSSTVSVTGQIADVK